MGRQLLLLCHAALLAPSLDLKLTQPGPLGSPDCLLALVGMVQGQPPRPSCPASQTPMSPYFPPAGEAGFLDSKDAYLEMRWSSCEHWSPPVLGLEGWHGRAQGGASREAEAEAEWG